MKLSSKKIQVGNVPLSASWSSEAIDDLKFFDGYYEYEYDNNFELSVVEKFFKTSKTFQDGNSIRFLMNNKKLRAIKLYIINKVENYEILLKIIKNSRYVDLAQDLEEVLVKELTSSIDKSILSSLMNLGK